ncbi:hypothetical protein ZWY2020_006335 [Hordeum vulgare]|nr:hypothetical protein ZWY2020_006335 [Hordeum vulgare]
MREFHGEDLPAPLCLVPLTPPRVSPSQIRSLPAAAASSPTMKYYNGCLFHKVEKDFLEQSGDPTGTGSSGDSVYKFLYGDQAQFFNDEICPELRHSKTGTIAMSSAGENCNASQFYITLRDDVDYLDDKHTVFGTVAEGLDTLTKINEAYADDKGRPFKDIRVQKSA